MYICNSLNMRPLTIEGPHKYFMHNNNCLQLLSLIRKKIMKWKVLGHKNTKHK